MQDINAISGSGNIVKIQIVILIVRIAYQS